MVAFDYNSPMEVSEVLDESPELLPTEEILDLARQMLPAKLETWIADADASEVHIQQMELTYWRIIDKNNPESATVIPVWYFYGAMNSRYCNSDGEKFLKLEEGQNVSQSILTLNAIEGTVVDLARMNREKFERFFKLYLILASYFKSCRSTT